MKTLYSPISYLKNLFAVTSKNRFPFQGDVPIKNEHAKLLHDWQSTGLISAKVWSYSVTLGQLEIRLLKKGTNENLHIICDACEYIRGPLSWSPANLHESITKNDFLRCVISDEKAGFSVTCIRFGVVRNVEPMYYHK